MDVVTLLQSRNRCLQRFLRITGEFRDTFARGDFSALEPFHLRRARIIQALELYDQRISSFVHHLRAHATLEEREVTVRQIEPILEARERLIAEILKVDQTVINLLDMEKSRLSNEAGVTRKIKSHLNKFKSAWVIEAGDGLDRTL